jgi:hypothetical protein
MLKAIAFIGKLLAELCMGLINLCVAEPGATLKVVGLFISILEMTVVGSLVLNY